MPDELEVVLMGTLLLSSVAISVPASNTPLLLVSVNNCSVTLLTPVSVGAPVSKSPLLFRSEKTRSPILIGVRFAIFRVINEGPKVSIVSMIASAAFGPVTEIWIAPTLAKFAPVPLLVMKSVKRMSRIAVGDAPDVVGIATVRVDALAPLLT